MKGNERKPKFNVKAARQFVKVTDENKQNYNKLSFIFIVWTMTPLLSNTVVKIRAHFG